MERGTTKGIWGFERKNFMYFVLKFLDFTKPFEVHTNASDFAIRAIFMQCGHPNAFENKKLYGA